MKKILSAAFIAGAVAAAVIIYLTQRTPEEKALDDIEDAADDAFDTMDKHLNRVENATEELLSVK